MISDFRNNRKGLLRSDGCSLRRIRESIWLRSSSIGTRQTYAWFFKRWVFFSNVSKNKVDCTKSIIPKWNLQNLRRIPEKTTSAALHAALSKSKRHVLMNEVSWSTRVSLDDDKIPLQDTWQNRWTCNARFDSCRIRVFFCAETVNIPQSLLKCKYQGKEQNNFSHFRRANWHFTNFS